VCVEFQPAKQLSATVSGATFYSVIGATCEDCSVKRRVTWNS
jgi:hypothetical protein